VRNMTSLFCRHNRMTAKCPICSKELEAELRAKAPPRPAGIKRAPAPRTRRAATPRTGALVTRKLARAEDDGYRNALVPGLRATVEAERLAAALTVAEERLRPPGPYEAVAAEPDREQATWLAFLLALAGPDAPELQAALTAAAPAWSGGEEPELPDALSRTVAAYRAWAQRAGSQVAAFEADPAWSPQRRFAKVLERLALPGFGRDKRFELLATLGAAGVYDVEAGAVHFGREDDATTLAAKRALVSGDPRLLERRAADLAAAAELPIAALDRGLALWGNPGASLDLTMATPAAVRGALSLR
jgi:hypothetical protein